MKLSNENVNYLIYITKYMGVALIAGSVVHVGTLQNGIMRYIILGIVGLILMLAGNILEAKRNGQKINLKYLTILTLLSFSTGFLSGGVQHYLDNPHYAGGLLAVGLFLSYVTFFIKEKIVINKINILIVLVLSILTFIVSYYSCNFIRIESHDGVKSSTATGTTIVNTHTH